MAVPNYGVIIDGIRLNTVNIVDNSETIKELKKQNYRVLTEYFIKLY